MTALLSAALAYAAAGWPVFPCNPRVDPPGTAPRARRSKAPLTPKARKDPETRKPVPGTGGLYEATTDADRIRAWWRKWPNALIGVPTGARCGAFVVDLDPDETNGTLDEILARLVEAVGPLPDGPVSETQSGGRHLWFALPADGTAVRNGQGKSLGVLGVDVRGDGGYVVVPPSVMAPDAEGVRRAYRWLAPPLALAAQRAADGDGLALPQPSEGLLDLVLRRGRFAPQRARPPAAAAPAGGSASSRSARSPARTRPGNGATFFADVNAAALAAIERWAPRLFPSGRPHATGAWRVRSEDLGRGLEEDISIHPDGIRDFGEERPLTPLDLVIEHGGASDAVQAAFWLCERLGRTPESLGWRGASGERPPPPGEGPAGREGAPLTSGGGGGRGPNESGPPDGGGAPPDDSPAAAAARCAGLRLNDTDNGRRLLEHFGSELLWVRHVGCHRWADTHWGQPGGDETAVRLAQRTAERIADEAPHLRHSAAEAAAIDLYDDATAALAERDLKGSEDERAAIREARGVRDAARRGEAALAARRGERWSFSVASGNANRINAMIAMAAPHRTIPPEEMDADPLAINVRNGTLRLEKARVPDPDAAEAGGWKTEWRVRLDPHRREDLMSKVMPVDWDPEAEAPLWAEFVARFQPRPAVAGFLQRFHGYALTGLMGEQVFVFNYGLGANGKSTFMEALCRLMGAYAQSLPAEALTGDQQRRGDQATPEFARLPGARLVRCAELPRGQGFRESTIKLLTGGEPMLVRHLHQGFFELHPTFKAIGSGNDRPTVGGVDEGIWRRMKLVPWEVTIPLAERKPMAKVLRGFAAEAPGILNWLLEGLTAYLGDGLQTPPEIQAATDSYRADMDPVGEFTNACVATAPGTEVTAREMYQAYVAWCHANSVKAFAERTFATIMVQKGFRKENARIRKYLDVTLTDVPEDPERQRKYSGWADG
jgi:putative DNA primase/helicase